jgi:3-hydroxyisobutyrate dehydrogenase
MRIHLGVWELIERVCIIGFGEAGAIFGVGLSKRASIRAYDILAVTPEFRERSARYERDGIEFAASASKAAEGAELVLSLVTATAALDVAREAATYLRSGQVFVDLNSVSPGTKKASAAALEKSGATYVDGAVMGPVPPVGIAVPILLAGTAGAALAGTLNQLGMNTEAVSDQVGVASATKMCRSVIIKGIEALCGEAFLAARAHGVEARVLASLSDTLPGTDWSKFAAYQIGRSLVHGRRRAAEMREVAATVSEAGIDPVMALATAIRQDWAADLSLANPALKSRPDEAWLETLDLILADVASNYVETIGI